MCKHNTSLRRKTLTTTYDGRRESQFIFSARPYLDGSKDKHVRLGLFSLIQKTNFNLFSFLFVLFTQAAATPQQQKAPKIASLYPVLSILVNIIIVLVVR